MSEENEAAREAQLARLRQKQEAYAALFGTPGKLTPLGEVVLRDLEKYARFHDRAITRDLQGRYDGGATAYNMGLHDMIKRIHYMMGADYGYSSGNTDAG